MAKIFYELRQNKNSLSKIFGKWFAHSKTIEVLNTRKMAQHISEHGSIFTPDVVYGVLEKFRSCLIEMLLDSKRVKIDGLGTFFTTIENEKGGAISADKFSVSSNLKALHIRFLPEQEHDSSTGSENGSESEGGGNTGGGGNTNQGGNTGGNQGGNTGGNQGGNTGGGGGGNDDSPIDDD